MPANRKQAGQRQDEREARAPLELVKSGGIEVPAPRKRWRKATVDGWAEFWSDPLAQSVRQIDAAVLRRVFDMRDLQLRAWERYEAEPFVDGSQGQPVTNPAFDDAMKLEKAIVALEDRIGLSPKAMANLGVTVGQAKLTAAELNRRALEESDDDDVAEILEADGWEEAN